MTFGQKNRKNGGSMAKALVLLAPGFEEIEAITIIDILRRGDVQVTVAGLESGPITGSHQITVTPDAHIADTSHHEYDILILPGGQPGTNNLKSNPTVLRWVRERFERGQMIGAICAAPTVLHAAGIAKGLRLTSYPSEKDVFKESIYLEEAVVRDRNVITSRGVGTAQHFGIALVEALQGKEKARDVAERILFGRY